MGIVLTAIASNRYEIWELIGLTLSLGAMTGGVGIPVAHELIHRRERTFQRMGLLLLAAVNYMHFKIEHLRGHHVRVATEEDPAIARRGESVWAFVPRSSIGQFKSAWALENKRLYANADTANMNWFKNTVFHYCTIQCLVAIIIFILLGLTAIIIFVAQSIFAITLLEFINYIEHYGLMRTKRSDGRYEAIRAHHSWTTNSLLTNIIAFNLGHHADHHIQPNRPFDELIDRLDAPHLPVGYLAMIYLACFPRFWRTVIHPRLDAFDVLCQDR